MRWFGILCDFYTAKPSPTNSNVFPAGDLPPSSSNLQGTGYCWLAAVIWFLKRHVNAKPGFQKLGWGIACNCSHWSDAKNKTMSTQRKVQGWRLTSSYNLCVCVCPWQRTWLNAKSKRQLSTPIRWLRGEREQRSMELDEGDYFVCYFVRSVDLADEKRNEKIQCHFNWRTEKGDITFTFLCVSMHTHTQSFHHFFWERLWQCCPCVHLIISK